MSPKTVTAIKHAAGRQPESAALRNVLAQLGACSSDLCTEEMLFGLGGGIGSCYFLFNMHGGHPVIIGTLFHASESDTPVFMDQMCEAWGVTAEVRHSSSRSAASKSLVKILNDGFTPIVWVEITKLPYMFLSGLRTGGSHAAYGVDNTHLNAYHMVVVYGMEEDEVIVGDLAANVFRMSLDDLTEARHSNYAPKFRRVVITAAPPKPDPRTMLAERIRGTCSQMIDGLGIANFGLSAMSKWAQMLTNTKNKKGWPNCFPPGSSLHSALSSVFGQIELRGHGGSGFRTMYADFIEQAADVLKKPGLRKVAEQFHESEKSWGSISSATLPNTIPLLKKTRAALTRRATLLRKPRTARIEEELRSLRDDLGNLRETSAKDLSLSREAALDLFAAMSARVLETEAIERAAFTELRSMV
jgi:hypothetical protein